MPHRQRQNQDKSEENDFAKKTAESVPVLLLDLKTLRCVKASANNLNKWGCRIVGDDLGTFGDNVAIKSEDSDVFQRARVTGHKSKYLTLVLDTDTSSLGGDHRKEMRQMMSVEAKVSDLARSTYWPCVITDASRTGCRIEGEGFEKLPEKLLVFMDRFERPVLGELMWSDDRTAGMRLHWDSPTTL